MQKIVSFNNRVFQNIFKRGKSYGNKALVVYYLPNELPYNRLGITVSKKIGNSVVRHRVKRLIKESFRLNATSFKQGYDFVFIARAGIIGKTYRDVESSLLHLMKKINMLS